MISLSKLFSSIYVMIVPATLTRESFEIETRKFYSKPLRQS